MNAPYNSPLNLITSSLVRDIYPILESFGPSLCLISKFGASRNKKLIASSNFNFSDLKSLSTDSSLQVFYPLGYRGRPLELKLFKLVEFTKFEPN